MTTTISEIKEVSCEIYNNAEAGEWFRADNDERVALMVKAASSEDLLTVKFSVECQMVGAGIFARCESWAVEFVTVERDGVEIEISDADADFLISEFFSAIGDAVEGR